MEEGKIARIQRELTAWQRHNFPSSTLLEPFAGIAEEWGEYAEALNAGDDEKQVDAVGDIVVFMCDACTRVGLDAQQLYDEGYASKDIEEAIVFKGVEDEIAIFCGRLLHSALKLQQGIRGSREEHVANIRALLVEMFSVLFNDTDDWGQQLDDIASDTFAQVSKRDWQADKLHGGQ